MIDIDQLLRDELDDSDPQRAPYFEALALLQDGAVEEAMKAFRRAARQCSQPFGWLSALATGQCQEQLGKTSAAMRSWRSVAEDEQAPHPLRYVAWLSIASLAQARHNDAVLEEATAALDSLGEPSDLLSSTS